MFYWICYIVMLGGYLGVSMYQPSIKMKIIGFLLAVVNGLIFFK